MSPEQQRNQVADRQRKIRNVLRFAGVGILLVGVLCLVAAVGSLVSSMIHFDGARGGPPRLFWLGFVGIPLLFAGSVMCMYAFMGAVFRFAVRETRPVAAETVNYMAVETQEAVKTVSKSIAEGVAEGLSAKSPDGAPATHGRD
jgi:hypothetical protein